MSEIPFRESGRRTPAKGVYASLTGPNSVFLTVCTEKRGQWLARASVQQALHNIWLQTATAWLVGDYLLMPDHIHLFCAPNTMVPGPLKNWVSYWRNRVTRRWPNRQQLPLWQRDFWDRQLRSGESYSQKWEYVRNNPVRHGYVCRSEDWLYQGELNVLEWHD